MMTELLSSSSTVKWIFSKTSEWIAMKIGTDIHDVEWLSPNDFGPVIQAGATSTSLGEIYQHPLA